MMGDSRRGDQSPVRENQVSRAVIGAAIEVHQQLGPGLLESTYEACLCQELSARGLRGERQRPLPVTYKGTTIEAAYRLDLVVEECVIVEVKAVEQLLPVHRAQLLTYLQMSGLRLGLLINFNVPLLHNGVKRVVNGLLDS